MSPRRSEGEESKYPFFEGDGSSSNEWGDYGVVGDDYEGPPVFDDDQYEKESMLVYDSILKMSLRKKKDLSRKEWVDDGVANDNYEEALAFDDDKHKEEVMTGDVGVNLMARLSGLTPQAIGVDWLKHNILLSTCTILGKVCTFVVDSGSCDNLIAEEAV
ncbi:hypothetical protein Tco_0498994 [Tanacetum coccineum]